MTKTTHTHTMHDVIAIHADDPDCDYPLDVMHDAHGVLTHYAERVAPFHYDLAQKALTIAARYDESHADDALVFYSIAKDVFDFLSTFEPEPADDYVDSLCAELNAYLIQQHRIFDGQFNIARKDC